MASTLHQFTHKDACAPGKLAGGASEALPSEIASAAGQPQKPVDLLLRGLKSITLSSNRQGTPATALASPAAAAASLVLAAASADSGAAAPGALAASPASEHCVSSTAVSLEDSSILGSPLRAFAAAKQRLASATRSADGLIASSIYALEASQAGSLARQRAAGSPLARLQQQQLPEADAVVARTSQAVAALTRRNTELSERLQSSLDACRALRAQTRESFGLVAELQADNERLSSSLSESKTDNTRLQRWIRQLSVEATQLSEQARLSLLADQPAPEPLAKPPAPLAEPPAPLTAPPALLNEPPALAAVPDPLAPLAGRLVWPGELRADRPLTTAPYVKEPELLELTRDWSSTASTCSSDSGKGSAWPPASSVRDFDTSGAPCLAPQAWGLGGDKRRRLAPGMLSHCLRASVALAAVAEETCGVEAAPPAAPRRSTPGRTPKRKLAQLAPSAGCALPAAPDAATPLPAASPEPSPATALLETPPTQLEDLFSAAAAADDCDAVKPAEASLVQREADLEARFRTFELFESKWHGGPSGRQLQLPARSGPQLRSSICAIM